MRFSIIVPVYNVEMHIEKCLVSLVNQSFEDYEIVVVNDETPDRSMDLVHLYQEKYPERIRIIEQKNKGLGGARNAGVAVAKGDYLLFVDSDDYLHTDALQILDENLRSRPCDLLFFNYAEVKENGELIRVEKVSGDPCVLRNVQTSPEILLNSQIACNKVFKRTFYLDCQLSFPEKTLYEDSIVRIFMARAQTVGICPECLYYYVQHDGSITHIKISPRMLEIIKVTDIVRNELKKHHLYDACKEYIEAALIMDIYSRICRINTYDHRNPMQKQLVDYIADCFPDSQSNSALSPTVKKELTYLCNYKFIKFYYRYSLIRKIKKELLQFSFIAKLNVLRGRLLGRVQ